MKEISQAFVDLADRKKIGFSYTSLIEKLHTSFDHDKLERILFNILSNAFKFTNKGGSVHMSLNWAKRTTTDQTWVEISISDTGIGIPPEQQSSIYDLFFQHQSPASILNQGTGIGLSITKEFVKMHGGQIEMESIPDKGTTFRVLLPLTLLEEPGLEAESSTDSNTMAENQNHSSEKPTADPVTGSLPTVLLVEDNDDFRFYLKDNLRLHYKVFEATNGKEGWQKTLTHHPQLIVSDISMPEMDGIQFCQKIKADKRTMHIPIILLTALTGEDDQLTGLKTGANDYITKPFNFELLYAKIKNLLVLNDTLKTTYSKQIKALTPEVEIQSADEKLLHTILKYLDENLNNSQLSVEELSRQVGMSRSSLYNKLLELTGQTPVEFIRSVKLEKAAILLEKSDMNVAEIAYSVGFSTPNYFAKSFKAKYNMLPSEYIAKVRKENAS
jgi:DNA-binding response OmpR family regulator